MAGSLDLRELFSARGRRQQPPTEQRCGRSSTTTRSIMSATSCAVSGPSVQETHERAAHGIVVAANILAKAEPHIHTNNQTHDRGCYRKTSCDVYSTSLVIWCNDCRRWYLARLQLWHFRMLWLTVWRENIFARKRIASSSL
jgi:hypothetical protein